MTSVTTDAGSISRAWRLLYITFGVLPIVAGLDKFTHFLVDWTGYLWPVIPDTLGISPDAFMTIVAIIEIVAGILVFIKPRIGGMIVALWLVLIALQLAAQGIYDFAVRDVVMALSAFALSMLSGRSKMQTA